MELTNQHTSIMRWEYVERIFLSALEKPDHERDTFLALACAGDEALRKEVAAMLAAHEREGYVDGLDAAQAVVLLEEAAAPETGHIGPYRLVGEVGRGGMGAVFLAERNDGQFEQQVALKLIKRGMGSDAVLQRFRTERQILARLQHPNIARLYDGGVTEEGRPYFAMEYVGGRPITQYCDEHQLGVAERLALFVDVCKAVQYAHGNLIVHRDLKPSNILVSAEGQVKLLDFGIAKVLSSEAEEALYAPTHAGVQAMTPEYAAPEQVLGEPVTTATDVYALGIVLYELLAGRRPYHLARRTPDELLRVICETEPERPSTALSQTDPPSTLPEEHVSQMRGTSPKTLRRQLSGDLDTVVLKALRKEPNRRYASAEAFVEDIKRHLAGLPVAARPDTAGYRLKKFVGRHTFAVVAIALMVLSLAVGFSVALWQASVAAGQRDLAQQETRKTEQVVDFMVEIFERSNIDESSPDTLTARDLLDRGRQEIEEELAAEPEVQTRMMAVMGRAYLALGEFDAAKTLSEETLRIRRTLYGDAHPDVAQSLFELGRVYHEQGNFAAADSFFSIWYSMIQTIPVEEDARQADRLWLVGRFHHFKASYESAETLMRSAIDLYQQAYGAEHPAIAHISRDIGDLYLHAGRYQEAEALFRETMARYEALDLKEGTYYGIVLGSLGRALWKLERYDEAEELLRVALERQHAQYGNTNAPAIATRTIILARFLHERGKYDEAETLFREAKDRYEKRFGPTYLLTLQGKTGIGKVLRDKGEFEAAEPWLVEVYDILREQRGPQNAYTHTALKNLASLYEAWGKTEQAAQYLALLTDTDTAPALPSH